MSGETGAILECRLNNIVEEDASQELEDESSNLTSRQTGQNLSKSAKTPRTNGSVVISKPGTIRDIFESFKLDKSLSNNKTETADYRRHLFKSHTRASRFLKIAP